MFIFMRNLLRVVHRCEHLFYAQSFTDFGWNMVRREHSNKFVTRRCYRAEHVTLRASYDELSYRKTMHGELKF